MTVDDHVLAVAGGDCFDSAVSSSGITRVSHLPSGRGKSPWCRRMDRSPDVIAAVPSRDRRNALLSGESRARVHSYHCA